MLRSQVELEEGVAVDELSAILGREKGLLFVTKVWESVGAMACEDDEFAVRAPGRGRLQPHLPAKRPISAPKNAAELRENMQALQRGPLDDEKMVRIRALGKAVHG
jgi:hypothetical protein